MRGTADTGALPFIPDYATLSIGAATPAWSESFFSRAPNGSEKRKQAAMVNIPIDNPDVICPDCRRPMVELHKMADVSGNDALGIDGGMGGFGNPYSSVGRGMILFDMFVQLIDFAFGSLIAAGRGRKLKRLAAATLPQFPRSLICPSCFFLLRRR